MEIEMILNNISNILLTKRKRIIILVIFFITTNTIAIGSNLNIYNDTITYNFTAGYELPADSFSQNYIQSGLYAGLCLQYLPPESWFKSFAGWQYYFLEGGIRYTFSSLKNSPKSNISWYTADAGPILFYPLFDWFTPFIGASIGGYYSMLHLDALNKNESNISYLYRAKAGFFIPSTASLSFRFEGSYNYLHLEPDPYKSLSIGVYASYNFAGDYGNLVGKQEAKVHIVHRDIPAVFAVRYLQYNAQGMGNVTIKNVSDEPLSSIRIETAFSEISADTKQTEEIKILKPGDIMVLRIPANISSRIASLGEDKKITLKYRVIYSTAGSKYYYNDTQEIPVYTKNAITWDKTEHLGSFITPKDETVSLFARKVIAETGTLSAPGAPQKLVTAMKLFNALYALGVAYVTDPKSDYSSLSLKKTSVDYVQFPAETLNKRAGDCDDLTALYASMLENVGINTAIATIPGHVFLLFDTEIPESSAHEVSSDKQDYLVKNGTVWIPVEITRTRETFMGAWREGAREVQTAGFEMIETMVAWRHFPPTGIEVSSEYRLPDSKRLIDAVSADIASLRGTSFDKKALALREIVKKEPGNFKAWNNLGILHGRYNMLKEAEECFKRSSSINQSYDPPLCNLGNVSILRKEYQNAVEYFSRALKINPGNSNARINLARAYYELREFDKARYEYNKAKSNNPAFSIKYSYLASVANTKDGDARSSDVGTRNEAVEWDYREEIMK